MNHSREELTPEDAKLFDLLADGELDDQRRRELLSRLDELPGGWRRCAVAFLEAQSWQREMGGFVTEAKLQAPAVPASKVQTRSRSWNPTSWLAVAASFIAAFGLGLFLRDAGRPGGGPSIQDTADSVTDSSQQAPTLPVNQLAEQSFGPQSQPGGGVMTMSYRPGPDGELQQVEVPYYDAGGISPKWLAQPASAVPMDVLRDLQRSGHRLEQSRELYPFELQDGRRGVVPVDQLKLHYVGNRSYQ